MINLDTKNSDPGRLLLHGPPLCPQNGNINTNTFHADFPVLDMLVYLLYNYYYG